MSIDELWELHRMIDAVLAARVAAKKAELERVFREEFPSR
jgi:hypothetical protein